MATQRSSSAAPSLSADEIDDLLYLARTGDTAEFTTLTTELVQRTGSEQGKEQQHVLLDVCLAARDEVSQSTVLHMAAANGHVDFLRALLTTIRPQSTTNASSSTPTSPNISKPIQDFINAPNDSGSTALHWAALNGQLACVQLLMEHGADPLLRNAAGHDAIYEAEQADRREVVEWVLREGGEAVESSVSGGGEGEAEEGEEVNDDDGEEEVVISAGDMRVNGHLDPTGTHSKTSKKAPPDTQNSVTTRIAEMDLRDGARAA